MGLEELAKTASLSAEISASLTVNGSGAVVLPAEILWSGMEDNVGAVLAGALGLVVRTTNRLNSGPLAGGVEMPIGLATRRFVMGRVTDAPSYTPVSTGSPK